MFYGGLLGGIAAGAIYLRAKRFPAQLCEAAGELTLFFVLWRLYRKGELRGDEYRGFLFGLSTSQWISIFVCAAAAVAWVCGKRRGCSAGATGGA